MANGLGDYSVDPESQRLWDELAIHTALDAFEQDAGRRSEQESIEFIEAENNYLLTKLVECESNPWSCIHSSRGEDAKNALHMWNLFVTTPANDPTAAKTGETAQDPPAHGLTDQVIHRLYTRTGATEISVCQTDGGRLRLLRARYKNSPIYFQEDLSSRVWENEDGEVRQIKFLTLTAYIMPADPILQEEYEDYFLEQSPNSTTGLEIYMEALELADRASQGRLQRLLRKIGHSAAATLCALGVVNHPRI